MSGDVEVTLNSEDKPHLVAEAHRCVRCLQDPYLFYSFANGYTGKKHLPHTTGYLNSISEFHDGTGMDSENYPLSFTHIQQ